ncbi:tRNA (adenine(58)-N(1))-methyltransferase TrmI OS=Streptomyces alboniger OX=132473 GN=CP975_06430 PE=3 SV=1 [Streptomyces alboniger]
MSEPTGAARRRGPFKVGDQVQLTDPKGRHYTFTLEAGKNFHTHKGSFPHDELIGAPEGSVVRTTGNVAYLALRPLLPDYVLSMPRGAAVVYPKDAGQILAFADIFPRHTRRRGGRGLGLAEQLPAPRHRRPGDAARISAARTSPTSPGRTWSATSAAPAPAAATWRPPGQPQRHRGRPGHPRHARPVERLEAVSKALVPGGILGRYVATTTQLARTVESIREIGGFNEPTAWELMIRNWHIEGLAVRPDHRMIGHTGVLLTARRLADGRAAHAPPPPRQGRVRRGLLRTERGRRLPALTRATGPAQ